MKKTYVKPTINLESFVLTQSIAHNCGDNLDFGLATLKYHGQCGWKLGEGATMFTAGSVCNVPTPDTDLLCYNNPGGGYNIFNS